MSLEQEIRQQLDTGATSSPAAKRALSEGPQDLDAMGTIENLVIPMLFAQRDAIVRLAREIDEMA